MFVFHFNTFLDRLDIQIPSHFGIPSDSPVLFFYKEKEDLSKHEILRRLNNLLHRHQINCIRPFKDISNEWVIDLKELRNTFPILSRTEYLKGKLTIEPDYNQTQEISEFTKEVKSTQTTIKFAIYPDEINAVNSLTDITISEEIKTPLERFHKDFTKSHNCGFLMMKYEDTPLSKDLERNIKSHFLKQGYNVLRADDKRYSDDLLSNIKTYMHGCSFGIALFERINTNYFNPNVSLEIGYMMSLNKPILYLKDKTLISLQSDLIGKLYYEFDFQNQMESLASVIDKWLADNEMI